MNNTTKTAFEKILNIACDTCLNEMIGGTDPEHIINELRSGLTAALPEKPAEIIISAALVYANAMIDDAIEVGNGARPSLPGGVLGAFQANLEAARRAA